MQFLPSLGFSAGERSSSNKSVRSIVYHGKLVSPDGRALSGDFTVQVSIFSPEPALCLLWSEKQSISVRSGEFSLELGYDSNRLSGVDGGVAQNFPQVFINNSSLNLSGAKCAVGSSYTSSNSEDRLLTAVFTNVANGAEKIEVTGLPIKAVPFALQAEAIGGYGLPNLMKISGAGSSVVFSPDEISSLSSLLGGNALWDMGNKRVTKVSSPIAADDAVNMAWVQSQLSSAGVADGGITTVKLADGAVTGVKLADDAVSFDKIQNVNSGILIGRASIGAGSIEEITLGAGLSLSGGVLNTTNAGSVTNVISTNSYLSVANGTSSPSLTVNVGTTSNTVAAGNDARITGALQRSGGTMTGALNMGGQDLTAVGNFALSDDKHLKLGSFAADPATAGWGNAEKGRAWFNTTTNQVKYWDGSAVQSLGVSGAGLTSLNGQSGGTQTFAEGTAGTDFDISSSGNVHTFNIPSASGSARGLLTAADWTLFNSKQPAGAYLTSISGGDVTAALGFTPISSVLPNGQVYVGNGSGVAVARYFGVGDLKTSLGAQQFPASCSASQTLNWSAVTDTFSCVNISLTSGQVTAALGFTPQTAGSYLSSVTAGHVHSALGFTPVSKAGDTMTGPLELPSNGLSVGSNQLVVIGGNVGIGTSSPAAKLDVVGQIRSSSTISAPYFSSPSGHLYMQPSSGAIVGYGNGQTYQVQLYDGSTQNVQIHSNGASFLNGGNVGIGTTSPGQKLTVAGTIESSSGGFKFPDGSIQTSATASGAFASVGLVQSSGQSLTGGAFTVLSFGSELWDTASFHDNISNNTRITIPSGQGGYYAISGALQTNVASDTWLYLKLNGTQVRTDYSTGSANSAMNWILQLNAGDYLEFEVWPTSTATTSASRTTFSAVKLAAGGADGLGDHLLTQNLRLNANWLSGDGDGEGIRIDNAGNVGIGTISPGSKLEVAGQIKITGGSPGAGKILQSDASGLASWVTPAGGGSGTVTEIFGTAPLSVTSSTTTPTISIAQANGSQAGYLSSADWTLFNNKQPAGNYLTAIAGASLGNGNIWVGNGSGQAAAVAMSGDVTMTNAGVTTVGKINNTTVTGVGLANSNVLQNTSGSAIAGNSVLVSNATATGVTALTTPASGVLISSGTVPSWSALTTDNFTQYALLSGRAGGQTLRGGNAASEDLIIDSTSHATKGDIVLNAGGGNIGIGTTSPQSKLHIEGNNGLPNLNSNTPNLFTLGSNSTVQLAFGQTATGSYPFWIQTKDSQGFSQSYPLALNPLGGSVGVGTSNPAVMLDVNGTVRGGYYDAGSATTLDWSLGNTITTTAGCSATAFTMNNMVNGASYTLILKASSHTAACSFTGSSVTNWRQRPFPSQPSGYVVITILKAGSDAFVSWSDSF